MVGIRVPMWFSSTGVGVLASWWQMPLGTQSDRVKELGSSLVICQSKTGVESYAVTRGSQYWHLSSENLITGIDTTADCVRQLLGLVWRYRNVLFRWGIDSGHISLCKQRCHPITFLNTVNVKELEILEYCEKLRLCVVQAVLIKP